MLEVYAGELLAEGYGRLVRLAEMFPDLTIVLNHCGSPIGPRLLSTPALVSQWKAGIVAVAAAGKKNVVCKVGGIQMAMNGFGWDMEAGAAAPPSSDALAKATLPYYAHCLDAFGERRAALSR